MLRTHPARLIASVVTILAAAPTNEAGARQVASDASAAPPTTHVGQPLDPATYGAGIVENMDLVLERDAARPDEPVLKGADTHGTWVVPSPWATYYPHSGEHNIVNRTGDTSMGIGFPGPTRVSGVWIAGQAGAGVWAKAVRVVGFLDGAEVATTPWFGQIGETPAWFALDLDRVDRIVFEARPTWGRGGWYALDDLTFTPVPADEDAQPVQVVIDFEDCRFGQKLTGTDYRGLTWEEGTGDHHRYDDGVPAPLTVPDLDADARPPAADDAAAPSGEGGIAGSATAPSLLDDFQGVIRGDAGSFSFPPDTCGAVGPDHFIEVVNRNFAVYDKQTGAELINILLGSFLPESNGDPRVLFDQHSGRWIVIVTDFDDRIFLAVSLTDDATGDWFKTSFVASAGSDLGCFPDYPTLGVDADGIYTSAFMAGCGMTIFAIDKAPLIDPVPSLGTITAFRNLPFEGAIQPALTYGTPGAEYFLSRSGSTGLRVRRLIGPLTSPSLIETAIVGVPFNQDPPLADAQGSTTPLSTVDSRLFNAVYRDGAIWAAHNIDVDGRSACRWYQVGVDPEVLIQSGTISSEFQHYFMPSISVNAQGDALIGFTASSSLTFPQARFSGRAATDPPGAMSAPALLKAGVAAQNNIDHFGRNRWGDYSLTTVDPDDELTFWTIQEYADVTDIWGTWVGKAEVITAPANDGCGSALALTTPEPFSTYDASTDGFPEPGQCGPAGGDDVDGDIWYLHQATCDGEILVSLSALDYDARLAVYAGCPGGPGEAITCIEGSDGSVMVAATSGQTFLIRVGGVGDAQGNGVLSVDCVPACGADCGDDSGVVDTVDLLELIAAWGAAGGSACDIAPPGGDGVIDTTDLLALIAAWGPCP